MLFFIETALMYVLASDYMCTEKKKLNKLVINLHLIAENNPALGICQPQNNASIGDSGPVALSHCDEPPSTLGIRNKMPFL